MRSHDDIKPPSFWLRFFRWYCRAEYAEDIEGDLVERFEMRVSKHGAKQANRQFRADVLKLFRPSMIKKLEGNQKLNYYGMFKHNFKITIRSFAKYRSTFIINLLGLSTGLASALFIYLWVQAEMSMDKFHEHDEQLYQVMLNHEESGKINTKDGTQGLLAEALEEEVPEITIAIQATPTHWFGQMPLSTEDKTIKAIGKFADPAYFEMFSFPFIQGEPKTALKDKGSIVISNNLATRLFGSPEAAFGQTIKWQLLNFTDEYKVAGVFKDLPTNTTDDFEFILAFDKFRDILPPEAIHWGNYNAETYVLLAEGTDVNALNAKLKSFVKDKVEWSNVEPFVRPFSDRYLYTKYENGVQAGGRIEYIKLFTVVSVFILLIACINFINLSTAKASTRAKEIGVKKAIGAKRNSLAVQYLQEAVLMTAISVIVAIGLVILLLPQFNQITGHQIRLNFDLQLIYILIAISATTGLLAGSYPAIFLSSLKPVATLKGKLNVSFGETWIRKGLVVFQFVLSVVLIASVLVVTKQIAFIQKKNIGYNRDNLVLFANDGKIADDFNTFLLDLQNIPGVVNAGGTTHTIVSGGDFTTGFHWEGENPEVQTQFGNMTVTYDFIETLGVEIKEGRSFSREFSTDKDKLILNEKAIEVIGYEDPIGKEVNLWGDNMTIIGVVKDFNFSSLHEDIIPMFFKLDNTFTFNILTRIQAGNESNIIDRIAELYKTYNPEYEFDYSFLDQEFAKQYRAEQRISKLTKYFGILAIIISCLGLFGLTAFTIERRLKEISIRKVLGSNAWSIITLLNKQFSMLVLLAILIGLPISYWATKEWLNGYAYKIELQWWFFVLAGALTLLIAWLTVSIQTFKTAKLNPTKSLRTE
ncbi:ABC transporter permease [Roseivirga pacifica]|uniref:ABC transporter permease n=1 Tax=Roseivirga pacifica TaxID=1267423 RepID=UPI003BB0FC5F